MPFCGCCKSCCFGGKGKVEILPELEENVKSMSVEKRIEIAKDCKNIHVTAIRVMRNYLGIPTYPYLTEAKQLHPYIRNLCGDQESNSIKQEWIHKELPNVQLVIVIKEAKLIHLKSEDSGSVQCRIWIKKENMKKTSIKNTKSDIIWDEVFILDVPEYDTDEVTIEVWSNFQKKGQSSGKKYSLIGNIVKPIKNFPCIGQEKMCSIKHGPRRDETKGQLSMFVQLTTKKSDDHMFHIHMHMELLQLSYQKQVPFLEDNIKWKNWLEVLPNSALTLIHQHGVQNGLTATEQCVCSWIFASTLRINQEDRISFYFLYQLLEGLVTDIHKDPIDQGLESALYSSISAFFEHMLVVIQLLHRKFQVQQAEQADELFYMLKCMSCVDVQEINSYLDSYSYFVKEGKAWYFSVLIDHKEDLKESDISVKNACDILKKIIKIYLRNQIILDDIFTRAWSVSYSHITLDALDEVLNDTIKPFIQHLRKVMENDDNKRDVKESLVMLQLYHNVRNLVNYAMKDLPLEREKLSMDGYSSWFGEDLILEWFLLCDMFTKPYIVRAVDFDQMEPLHRDIPHGTSVLDVVSIIDEMVIEVWTKLNWNEQIYTHSALMDAIKTCVLDYIKAISKRIKAENYFCGKAEFTPNLKLCVALSNVYAIFEHLYSTRNKIKSVLRTAGKKYGFTIMDPMASIGSQMQIVTAAVYLSILRQIDLKLRKLTRKVLKGRLDILGSHTTVVADTCAFVENTLELLYRSLKEESFYIILRHMWMMVVISFRDGLTIWKGCALALLLKKSAYMSALQTLTQIQQIFYCEGRGLTYFEMECQVVNDLRERIEEKVGKHSQQRHPAIR